MAESTDKQLDDILSRYSRNSAHLITILQDVQRRFGYLPEAAMERVARFLRVANSTVYSVSTFYSHFKLSPTGRVTVKVCRGTACHVCGGALLLREVEKQLGIKSGETSGDGEYTLETIACFGPCALAPIMVVNDSVHGRVTTTEAGHILSSTDN